MDEVALASKPGQGRGAQLKCIVILSTKCAGSSALQRRLTALADIRHVRVTRHNEQETLYWTKAASVLGLPQVDLPHSKVPIPGDRAKAGLIELLTQNVPDYAPPSDDQALVFDGWQRLCETYAPVFVEKSPHHLHQWSALELMLQCRERMPEIDFLFIALIRNPLSVLYSMWQQWRIMPEEMEPHWRMAYDNLHRLTPLLASDLLTIRYEDLVRDDALLDPVREFAGAMGAQHGGTGNDRGFHARSIEKWRADRWFGYQLDPRTIEVAEAFGYAPADLVNERNWAWPVYKRVAGGGRGALRKLLPKSSRRRIRQALSR